VDVVVSTHQLSWVGGTETYTLTVAEQLERIGHATTIFALEAGDMADVARDRGLRVVSSEEDLPDVVDVVYAQESITVLQLAARYPGVPCVMALHSKDHSLWVSPQLPGAVAALVATNEIVRRRAESFAVVPELVRLRQPVDTERFRPLGPLRRERPRVLLLGNYVSGDRRELVFHVCAELGYECRQVGYKADSFTLNAESELNEADIVVGKARVIVEAMACGRAAYVYDHGGGDGWVTSERYPLLEADNFGGRAEPLPVDRERLVRELAGYRPEMGPVNRDLAYVNHNASDHATQLASLFKRLAPRSTSAETPLRELARLVRLQWQSQARETMLAGEVETTRARLEELAAENERMRVELLRRDGNEGEMPPQH